MHFETRLPEPDELRFCVGQPVFLRSGQSEVTLWPRLDGTQISQMLQAACRQSVYAHTNTIRQGYVSLPGGYRLGICGTGVCQDQQVQTLTAPSSLVLRCPRAYLGTAAEMGERCKGSVLIAGPPGSGKTTLLRDFVRLLSDEKKQRVGLADERGEISGMWEGRPQFEIGSRTDVMVQVPKADAVMMLLRTMNPQWIIMDEITAPEDVRALSQASYCGVKLAATAHAETLEDLTGRPLYRMILESGVFLYLVLLRPDRSYEIKEVHA